MTRRERIKIAAVVCAKIGQPPATFLRTANLTREETAAFWACYSKQLEAALREGVLLIRMPNDDTLISEEKL